MSFFGGFLDQLLQPLIGLRATEYTIVACGALWAHEYFLTLDREVFFVWGSKWSFGKIIFILNRYSPMVDTGLAIYVLSGVKNPDICPQLARATAWFFVIGMFFSETILAMRTYAIWGGRRSILIFLVLFTLSIYAAAAYLMEWFLDSLTFIQIPSFLKPAGVTCAPMPAPGHTYLEFVIFMINQIVIAIMTLYRGFRQYRRTRHPMIKTMFQDGLMYYIYTLVLAVANFVVAFTTPLQWSVLLELPLRVISSICCTRVLLNIRGAYFNPNETTHNGVVQTARPSKRNTESSADEDEGSTTVMLSDPDRSDESFSPNGWRWDDDGKNSATRLALRPVSPFECEMPEVV